MNCGITLSIQYLSEQECYGLESNILRVRSGKAQ